MSFRDFMRRCAAALVVVLMVSLAGFAQLGLPHKKSDQPKVSDQPGELTEAERADLIEYLKSL